MEILADDYVYGAWLDDVGIPGGSTRGLVGSHNGPQLNLSGEDITSFEDMNGVFRIVTGDQMSSTGLDVRGEFRACMTSKPSTEGCPNWRVSTWTSTISYDPEGGNPYWCVWSPMASFWGPAREIPFEDVVAEGSGLDYRNPSSSDPAMIEGSRCGAYQQGLCGDSVENKSAAHRSTLATPDPSVERPSWIQGDGVFEFLGADISYLLRAVPERIWGDESVGSHYVVERYTAWTMVENVEDRNPPLGVAKRNTHKRAVVFAEGMGSQPWFVRHREVQGGIPDNCPASCSTVTPSATVTPTPTPTP
jgi:hypothetical protein